MSDADRLKWDTRYAEGAYAERPHATALLSEWLGELPRGRALDVACGAGRNAIALAQAGYVVEAVDISTVGLEQGRRRADSLGVDVHWHVADLESTPPHAGLPAGEYDLIVVVRYVNLALLAQLAGRLAAGGYLVSEQHLRTNRKVIGPRNPAYRLRANALLGAVPSLRVIAYREGLFTDPDGRCAALAQLVACREPAMFDRDVAGRA